MPPLHLPGRPRFSQNYICARRELRNDLPCGFHAVLCGTGLTLQRDVSVAEEGHAGGPVGLGHQAWAWHHPFQFHFPLFYILGSNRKDCLTKICTATITTTKGFKISGLVSLVHCIDKGEGRPVLGPWLLLVTHRLCP